MDRESRFFHEADVSYGVTSREAEIAIAFGMVPSFDRAGVLFPNYDNPQKSAVSD